MENIENKDLDRQIEDAILAMAKDPKNTANYHTLSKLYLEKQDYDKVMSVLESLLTIEPNDVEALVGMGTMWFYERDFRKSLSYYNKALEINPKNFLIYYNIGNVFAEWKLFSIITEPLICVLQTLKSTMQSRFFIRITKNI